MDKREGVKSFFQSIKMVTLQLKVFIDNIRKCNKEMNAFRKAIEKDRE